MAQEKKFKEATWWPQFLGAKPLELFVNLEESEAAFTKAHPAFENESLGHRSYRGNIGLKKKQPVTPDEFRNAHPDFAPDEWWTYRSNDGWNRRRDLQWRLNQKMLRDAWEYWSAGATVGMFQLMAVILSVVNPEDIVDDPGDANEKKPTFGNIMQVDGEGTYYKSLVWLNSQPWRAKTCKTCGRRFIASWSSNECCSHHCIPSAAPSYKRDYRNARSDKYNAARRRARAKSKIKRAKRRAK